MGQTVTVGGILLFFLIVGSLGGILFGVMMSFGAGMASSPTTESKKFGRQGCAIFLISLVVLTLSLLNIGGVI